jgi:hypothetical protein
MHNYLIIRKVSVYSLKTGAISRKISTESLMHFREIPYATPKQHDPQKFSGYHPKLEYYLELEF